MTENDLRNEMKKKGMIRRDAMGEVWSNGFLTVTIGANQILISDNSVNAIRLFNRAIGGLVLAIEYIKNSQ